MMRLIDNEIFDVVWTGRMPLVRGVEANGSVGTQLISLAPERTAQGNHASNGWRKRTYRKHFMNYFRSHKRGR
jgi:hypothetical protein